MDQKRHCYASLESNVSAKHSGKEYIYSKY